LCAPITKAQIYYGKDLFGKLQIVNDSTGTITFITWLAGRSVDSCYIRKHGDTIFLSTKARWRNKVSVYKTIQTATNPWFPAVIKIYEYNFHEKKYEYISDNIGIYDSTKQSIVLEENVFGRGTYIIVYRTFLSYFRVKCSFNTDRNYVVLEGNPDYNLQGVVFDEFPLLAKKNRLIPIDKKKQLECWLDNGFFFPKMKISKKEKKYDIISGHYVGLRNLPMQMREDISKPLPRKYLEYLNRKMR
jgi:hypothetical protein